MVNRKQTQELSNSSISMASQTNAEPLTYPDSQENLRDKSNFNTNPAVKGYYDSQTRKNNAISWLIKIGIPLLGFAVAIAGYYLASIREPIIRLEDKVENLKEQTQTNTNAIDGLKQYMYSHPAQSLQTPQK